jgi:hypothetical protein
MKRVVALIWFTVAATAGWSQITQVNRYEREQKSSDNSWTIISLREKGLALVRDQDKFQDGQKLFEVVVLDTMLNEQAAISVSLPPRMKLIGYDYSGGNFFYILFRGGEMDIGDLHLVEIRTDTHEVLRHDIKNEFNFKLTHFSVVDRNMILGGYVSREPAVLLFDIVHDQRKVIPGFFTANTELLDLRVNENNTFNTLVTNRTAHSKKTLLLRTFDKSGVQLLEDEVEIDQDKTILSGLTSSLIRDELFIAGTYSIGNGKMAAGFFAVLVDPFHEQAIRYYDFAELNHFLDFINPKRAERIKSAARRDREHGRAPEFRSNVTSVRLDERPSGFYLLAETFTTTTSSSPYPYQGYSPYSPYGMYNYSPFSNRFYNSPYNYQSQPYSSDVNIQSSSVIAFAPDGRLEWDHCLKLKDVHRPALEQSSDFWCNNSKIVISNKRESELFVKARFKNDETSGDTLKIMQRTPEEIVRDETREDGGVRFWFGSQMYLWGYQTVRDPLQPVDDRVRSVFYIIKADAY